MDGSATSRPASPRRGDGIDAGARLDRLRVGRFHRRVMWLIGLGMFLDACDIYLAGGVLGSLVKSGWSDLQTNAMFLSMTFMGMLLGTLFAGVLGDRFGRRFSYQVNLLIFGLSSIAAAFAPTMQVLIACRFVMGIGMGAEIIVGYSSLAEFMPRARRGRYAALLSVMTNMAVPVVGLGGAWVIPALGWRYMFGVIGLCALGVWVLRKNMPESPRWLESRGRLDEAEALLSAIEAECAKEGPLLPVVTAVQVPPAKGSYAELFKPGLVRSTVLGMIISIVGGINLYGFLSWIPTFLVKQGFTIGSSLWFSGIMGVGAPIGGVVGALIADRFGRVRCLVTLALVEAVLGLVYPNVGNGVELIVVGFSITVCAYAIVAIGTALYLAELFPTRLRLRGVSVAGGVGRLATSGVGFAIVTIYTALGIAGVSGFLTGSLVLLAVAVLWLGRETSNRSLEEISAGAAPMAADGAMALEDR